MTRLAVISDIHGNLPALEAVLDDLAATGIHVDQIVAAGDVINWGPLSRQVVERVRREGWIVIRGNNELYMVDFKTPRAPAHWNLYAMPPWTLGQLGSEIINDLATWPDTLCLRFRDAPSLRVVHGSPRSHFEAMHPLLTDEQLVEMLNGVEETTVIAGHTHLMLDRHVGRWHIINSGTIGVPLDGDPRASYMIIEGNADGWTVLQTRRVAYDRSSLYRAFDDQAFLKVCGPFGRLVIREFETARCHVYPFNAWVKAHHPGSPTTDALIDRFYAEADIWDYLPPEYVINRHLGY